MISKYDPLADFRVGRSYERKLVTARIERNAVSNDNVVQLIQPGTFQDQLTEVLRRGARDLLAQAVEAEVAEFR